MKQPHTTPPESTEILMQRCRAMAGLSIGSLAEQMGIRVPADLKRSKGWQGQVIEQYLGATASTYAEPDFVELGIELKTLPLDEDGHPKESTYVCTVSLNRTQGVNWQDSWLRQKLSKVLWVPVDARPEIPLASRIIGNPLLWQPDPDQTQALRQDWEELMDMVCLGQLEKITSHHGRYLQIRPKAANARALCQATDEQGDRIMTLPRGFYLRPCFTRQILQQHYVTA